MLHQVSDVGLVQVLQPRASEPGVLMRVDDDMPRARLTNPEQPIAGE